MLIETIGAEIAKRSRAALQSLGLKSAWYPAPFALPALPTLIVLLDSGIVEEMNEQKLDLVFRGLLFTSLEKIENQIADVDPMLMTLIDAFSANANKPNHRLQLDAPDADGALWVDFCRVDRFEASVPIVYGEKTHYGARIWWGVKVRRNPGAA